MRPDGDPATARTTNFWIFCAGASGAFHRVSILVLAQAASRHVVNAAARSLMVHGYQTIRAEGTSIRDIARRIDHFSEELDVALHPLGARQSALSAWRRFEDHSGGHERCVSRD